MSGNGNINRGAIISLLFDKKKLVDFYVKGKLINTIFIFRMIDFRDSDRR